MFGLSDNFVSSLVGAFVGAVAAFLLNAARELKLERDKRFAAIVGAQYALGMMRNDVQNLLEQFLEPHRNTPNRHTFVPQIMYSFSKLRVDPHSLNFLVASEKGNEVTEVLLAQACYENTLQILEHYNRSRIEFENVAEFQHSLEGQMASFAIAQKDLLRFLKIKQDLDSLYSVADDSLVRIDAAIVLLARVGKECLFERSFLRFEARKKSSGSGTPERMPEVI